MKRTIAICIATYRRPELLGRLLQSIEQLDLPMGYELEVRVVDNDHEGTAREVVNMHRQTTGAGRRLRYSVEAEPNIALSRNRALEMGAADLVFFVDDDERLAPSCLRELLTTMKRVSSDVVVGQVLCESSSEISGWIRRGGFLDHPTRGSGEPIDWRETRCGCTLVRGSWFSDHALRFDAGFGRSGGEDADLFFRISQLGGTMHAESRALAWEVTTPDRASFRGLARRRWRSGQCFHRIDSRDQAGISPPLRAAFRLTKSLIMMIGGLPMTLFGRPETLIRGALLLPLTAGGLVAWLFPTRALKSVSYGSVTPIERTDSGGPSCASHS